ncbi:MAG: hypothetical protein JO113_05405 [Candidatus Eremiobacteraeota bacterium]|nr:hypothetical protein [Candidatus Eremiobacteraeota bacterium]
MLAATVAMSVFPGAAMARGYSFGAMVRSYSGSYPVTVTDTQRGNFTGCLTLTGNGSASLVIGSQKFTFGTYLVIDDTFVATIEAQGYGQNAGLVFIAPASRRLGQGVYEEVYGGEDFESGALAFGMKGGC